MQSVPDECVVIAAGGDVSLRHEDGAWLGDGPGGVAEGSLISVLATCVTAPDAEWVNAVADALKRELAACGTIPRIGLIVRRGTAEDRYVHVTRSTNRASIFEHGLDWQWMSSTPGIAGSRAPERQAIFLDAEGLDSFFRRMTADPTDVWAVDVDGLWLESAPDSSGGLDDGWSMCATPIPPSRLTLLAPGPEPSR